MFHYIRMERLASYKPSSLLGPFRSSKKMKSCEYGPRGFSPSFSPLIMNWLNKLECLALVNLSSLVLWNGLAYRADSKVTKKMKCCEYGPKPNKLECLTLVNLSSLVLWNGVAYWADSKVSKKMKNCEYGPRGYSPSFSPLIMNWPNKLECMALVNLSKLVL